MEHPSLPCQVSAASGQSTSSMARRDSENVLAQLRRSISDSNLSLDNMLDSIVQVARLVVYADGAAIAMRRDNVVVCQARSGDMGPELGTEFDADSRISGQCLRTGGTLRCDDTDNDPRVDAEVCRSAGLRSVAVVPVGKKPAVSGVLEAFSALPNAFDDSQVELLEEMAELVIAAQRRSAKSRAEAASQKLPNTRKYIFILAAVAVLILLSWLVFRGKSKNHALSVATLQPVGGPSAWALGDPSSAGALKPNLSPVDSPRSATPNLPSSMLKGTKTEKDSLTGDVTVRKFAPAPVSNQNTSPNVPNGLRRPPAQNPDQAAETAPALSALSTSVATSPGGPLPGGPLFAASNNLPREPVKVSQGISGGTIEQQVNPIYPREGLVPKEAQVLLQAVVAEDGTVHDLKVIKGHPLLARAAIQAVAQWRYRPFLLDGQPISMPIEITLVFKRP
jgi:TonB family protein